QQRGVAVNRNKAGRHEFQTRTPCGSSICLTKNAFSKSDRLLELWPMPEGCCESANIYPKFQQQVGPKWGISSEQPIDRVQFSDRREWWVVCQRAKLRMDDLRDSTCCDNDGILVQINSRSN
ncbi:MAG: hypothetical protein ACLQSR_12005, partial [Limisphaerales bacterium]